MKFVSVILIGGRILFFLSHLSHLFHLSYSSIPIKEKLKSEKLLIGNGVTFRVYFDSLIEQSLISFSNFKEYKEEISKPYIDKLQRTSKQIFITCKFNRKDLITLSNPTIPSKWDFQYKLDYHTSFVAEFFIRLLFNPFNSLFVNDLNLIRMKKLENGEIVIVSISLKDKDSFLIK